MRNIIFIVDQPCEPISQKAEGIYKAAGNLGWRVNPIAIDRFQGKVTDGLARLAPDGCIVDCSQLRSALDLRPLRHYPTVYVDLDPAKLPPGATTILTATDDIVSEAVNELRSCHPTSWAFVGYGLPSHWSPARQRRMAELLGSGVRLHCYTRPWLRQNVSDACHDLGRWLSRLPKPCGLFAANDETAATVCSACADAGIRIPDEIALVSADNDPFRCENASPTISSVGIDFVQCGQLAVRALNDLFEKRALPRVLTYGTTGLTRRQSTTRGLDRYPQVAEMLEIIRRESCRGLTAKALISRMQGSRRKLETHFRLSTGKSIRETILDTRLKQVMVFLRRPQMAIGPIANICGWRNEAHLKRYFKQRTGLTMKQWRATAQLLPAELQPDA